MRKKKKRLNRVVKEWRGVACELDSVTMTSLNIYKYTTLAYGVLGFWGLNSLETAGNA